MRCRLSNRGRASCKVSQETNLALSSRRALPDPAANAKTMLEYLRGHWQIENGIHYSRDRSYDEDRCQVRDPNSAQILATLRCLARFLAVNGAHRPRTAHERTTPGLNRFCNAKRDAAIGWLLGRRALF